MKLTRLESGGFPVKKDWHSLDERSSARPSACVRVNASPPVRFRRLCLPYLPLIYVHRSLGLEQAIANLLDNAATYTPADTPIEITAHFNGNQLVLSVRGQRPRVSSAWTTRSACARNSSRGTPSCHEWATGQRRTPGCAGLGLAICKGIIEPSMAVQSLRRTGRRAARCFASPFRPAANRRRSRLKRKPTSIHECLPAHHPHH